MQISRTIFTSEVNTLFESLKLNNLNNHYIIAGDLNARHPSWGDVHHHYKEVKLYNWNTNTSHIFKARHMSPNKPTYNDSHLDHVIFTNRNY